MITQDETRSLLTLQARAYRLLIWLGQKAVRTPAVLCPEAVSQLRNPAACARWLAINRSALPSELLPDGESADAFATLLSSFFSTSFRVEHFSFGQELLDSNLAAGVSARGPHATGYTASQALALRHLGGSEGLRISDSDARVLARRKSMQPSLLLWTYVWELDRRVRGKGKGEVVHRIWRSLPIDLRKNITAENAWEARATLLESLRCYLADDEEDV